MWREERLLDVGVLQRVRVSKLNEHECDSPKVNVWCSVMKNNIIGPFFFQETAMTGETFLAMMEGTFLRHIPAGTVFQLDGAPPNFSRRVRAFSTGRFLIVAQEGGAQFPGTLVHQISLP
jgi:hypothetical protein